MDDLAARLAAGDNPYMQGGNPYMKGDTPGSGMGMSPPLSPDRPAGDIPEYEPDMPSVTDVGPTPQTTKPRQMPSGGYSVSPPNTGGVDQSTGVDGP